MRGIAEIEVEELRLDTLPETKTKVMLNLANPAAAARWWRLPADGVGLARMEFVINERDQGASAGAVAFRRVEGRGREGRDRGADQGL